MQERPPRDTAAKPGVETSPPDVAPGTSGAVPLVPGGQAPKRERRTNLAARGEPMVWLTGGCIAAAVLMIVGLLAFIAVRGFVTFWPGPLYQVALEDGSKLMGEVSRTETIQEGDPESRERILYQSGNFDLTGEHFTWVGEGEVESVSRPEWGLVIERLAWGRAYGVLEGISIDGELIADAEGAWARFEELHATTRDLIDRIDHLERSEMGEVSEETEEMRIDLRAAEREFGADSPEYRALVEAQAERQAVLDQRFAELSEEVAALREEMSRYRLIVRTAGGQIIPENRLDPETPMLVAQVVRAYPANQLGLLDKVGVYLSRWAEFLTDRPREANAEGGVFPAIIGTVLLTFIMIIFVVPVGVIAAIYLREYAKQGMLVSIVRISVNNLAGVPSIVYGVFGLGFFIYGVGAWIDAGPEEPFTESEWWAVLGVTAFLVLGALGLSMAMRGFNRDSVKIEESKRAKLAGFGAFVLWVTAAFMVVWLVRDSPFFHGFYRDRLPTPTVGKTAMIWASLTLAILTLPVVIVATEEALAAVPRSMREGSYACGASKWQTIFRIVLPRALPGMMTGMILAIARGAGEVAPLMLVGAVKLAPKLPISAEPPFFGSERSFMHLGFHIFDLGFQSQNSEAAKSMVFTTTLLLIAIVITLNVAAILIRSRLRKAYAGGQF